MKKLLALMLSALLICSAALAESADNAPDLPGAEKLTVGEKTEIDLDGDGESELLHLEMQGDPEEPQLTVIVTGSDGAVYEYATDIIYYERVYAMDVDGDGKRELLLSGDVCSDDYFTWCLRYDAEVGLTPVQFPDATRGMPGEADPYQDCGYGLLEEINDGALKLMGSQDVLGTWMCTREVKYDAQSGRFEFADNGAWLMNTNGLDWNEEWLPTTKTKLPATIDGEAAEIPAHTKLLPTSTDKQTYVNIVLEDGREASLEITPDAARGYGYTISGVADDSYFEYLPYAD